jgi:hypothetical protein
LLLFTSIVMPAEPMLWKSSSILWTLNYLYPYRLWKSCTLPKALCI